MTYYKRGIEQSNEPNKLRFMGSAADGLLISQVNPFIRELLFNESDFYVSVRKSS